MLINKNNTMTYDNLTHEERELVLYIQNNEQAFFTIYNTNKSTMKVVVKQCAINYVNSECTNKDTVYDIWTKENFKKVAEYFNSK